MKSWVQLSNQEIPDEFYGKWLKKTNINVIECLSEKDFHLPKSQAEWDEMKTKMMSCGIEESKIKSMMQERFQKYEQVLNKYKDKQTVSDIELN